METKDKGPILRKCACGCRRVFAVAYEHIEKRYFDRHCANNHIKRPPPKRRVGARSSSGSRVHARSQFALCEFP